MSANSAANSVPHPTLIKVCPRFALWTVLLTVGPRSTHSCENEGALFPWLSDLIQSRRPTESRTSLHLHFEYRLSHFLTYIHIRAYTIVGSKYLLPRGCSINNGFLVLIFHP